MARRKSAATIPQLIQADPVASAHLSRRGRGNLRAPDGPRITEKDRVWLRALEPNWLPSEADLNGMEFEGLEELRAEQTRFLGQLAEARKSLESEEQRFEQADEQAKADLREAYATGGSIEALQVDDWTDANERATKLRLCKQNTEAAYQAAVEWAKAAVQVQQELLPKWEATLAEGQAEIRSEIEHLNNKLDELTAELRADDKVRHWLNRIGKPMPGEAMGFGDIHVEEPVPEPIGPIGMALLRKEMVARGFADPNGSETREAS